MKFLTALVAYFLFVITGLAQFSSLPPSATIDGISVHSISDNAGAEHWNSTSSLGAYETTGDGYSDGLAAGSADSHLGLTWQQTVARSLSEAKASLNAKGGFIRAVFVGESAGWKNDFGYAYSGKPSGSDSYTIFQNIQSDGAGATVHFGDYVDIRLGIGEAEIFDFWYNSVGEFGLDTPLKASGRGGIYSLFNPSDNNSSSAADQFLWSNQSIQAATWIPSMGTYMGVDTYLVSIEDWRLSAGSDRDYSDFRIGLQFFEVDGTPLASIPEPATVGLWLGLVVLGWTAFLRLRRPSAGALSIIYSKVIG